MPISPFHAGAEYILINAVGSPIFRGRAPEVWARFEREGCPDGWGCIVWAHPEIRVTREALRFLAVRTRPRAAERSAGAGFFLAR
jgi:hypothetical protein